LETEGGKESARVGFQVGCWALERRRPAEGKGQQAKKRKRESFPFSFSF
jgi:hypothetical protein